MAYDAQMGERDIGGYWCQVCWNWFPTPQPCPVCAGYPVEDEGPPYETEGGWEEVDDDEDDYEGDPHILIT